MELIKGCISVILPVYNSEYSIRRCIESVLNQTYSNFELIVIDDGSKDNSYNICQQILSNIDNAFLLSQENMGVSGARNTGLKQARGEFVFFIDSDDTLHFNCFHKLMEINNYDLVACSYVKTNKKERFVYPDILTDSHNDIGALLLNNLSVGFSYVWGKLFRRSIICENNILFDLSFSLGEDTLFINSYLIHIQSIALSSFIGYNYSVLDSEKRLSFQSVSLNYIENQLCKLINSYHNIESAFNVDLNVIILEIKQFFIHRYIASFITNNNKLGVKKLENLFEQKHLQDIFNADGKRQKGRVQMVFDFFIKCRNYKLAFLYWKYIGKYYF